ncbi:MAG TPA: hypothetical protein VGN83_20360 [Falsiroseomonas sp.]|jgi:hypothetical protein|nr:hypothetical protein [Falsiroseomonas sp.]
MQTPPSSPVSEEFITRDQFCARYRISKRTEERQRLRGDGPPFVRVGPRRILYRLKDCATWEAGRTFAHRAAEMAGKVAA